VRIVSLLAAVLTLFGAVDAGTAAVRPIPDFADLAEDLLPTVVNISSAQTFGDPGVEEGSPLAPFSDKFRSDRAVSLGSGFLITADGLVVTNHHVIKDADEISATLHDGREYSAQVIGTDPATDLAVLKLAADGEKLPFARFGDSDKARVGEWVVAIGNPFGLGGSVTTGIISARNRDIEVGQYDDFIQTDAAINRGNSGGPLFDLDGRVIGVNTAIYSQTGGSVGVGFAVPSDLASSIVQQIVAYGEARRGWLGVNIAEVTEQNADEAGLNRARGARVSFVQAGSPAAVAGFEVGDIILEFNGDDIDRWRDLPRAVADAPIGADVPVELLRDGRRVRLTVQIGEAARAREAAARRGEGVLRQASGGTAYKGMILQPASDDVRRRFGINGDVDGVVVTRVDPDSPAAGLLQPGDVILEMGWEATKAPSDVVSRMDKLSNINAGPVTLYIQRGDVRFYETLRPEAE